MRASPLIACALALATALVARADGPAAPAGPGSAPRPAERVVGLLLPAEAEAARDLADGLTLGLEPVERAGSPAPQPFVVRSVASRGTWDALARDAADLVTAQRAVALVTPPDREVAHLATQIGTRLSTPVFSTSGAGSVAGTGSTWVLRVVPTPTEPPPTRGPEPRRAFAATSAEARAFVAAYERRFGRSPSTWSSAGYDAGRALVAGWARAQGVGGTALRTACQGLVGVAGASGAFDLDARGQRVR